MSRAESPSLVSVIIPCYNDESHVGEAIESALSQTYASTEVIVVDDGSTDDSLRVIHSFGEQITCLQQENKGASAARNHGLKKAKGYYIKFLDSDAVLGTDALARQVHESQKLSGERAFVFGNLKSTRARTLDGEVIEEASLEYLVGPGVSTMCPLHRYDFLQEVGGFNEDLPCGQEFEMHLRMKLRGLHFHYDPKPVVRELDDASQGISDQTFAGRDPYPRMGLFQRVGAILQRTFGDRVPYRVRHQLAKRWWITGRQALRGGHRQAAEKCFAEARVQEADGVVGSKVYRLLASILGPFYAENVGLLLKRISRSGS